MSKYNNYEGFNCFNEALLKRAIDKAFTNNHKLYFNVYNECDRADGTPWIETISTPNDVYECDEDGVCFACPLFDKGGCADLVINDGTDVYYVLYQDGLEERVYIDNIKDYLD